jgi:hypothetical protein
MGDRGLCASNQGALREFSAAARQTTYIGPGKRRRRRMMEGPERSKGTVRK